MRKVTFKDLAVKKEGKWEGNILRLYAERMMEHPIEIEEVWKVDMTNKFFKELDRELKNKEIIKLQINAKPRMSKSTVGITIGLWMKGKLIEYYPELVYDKEFGMRNICRDDQEYVKNMRNEKLMYDVLVIDEENEMENTGENVTIERAQKDNYSNIQAGRYVHTINIRPEGVIDENSDIKLEVRNKEKGLTHCYLYYNLSRPHGKEWVPLGYVDINVKPLIKNWLQVEKRFYEYLKTKEEKDRKYLDYWKKKDFYIEYMIKKYEKMDLMNKEGILRARDLDYSEVVLSIIEQTVGLTNIMNQAKIRNTIEAYVEKECEEKKVPLSLIGSEKIVRRIMNVLTLYYAKKDLEQQKEYAKGQIRKGKITMEQFDKRAKELNTHEEQITNAIRLQLGRLRRLSELNKKYGEHYK